MHFNLCVILHSHDSLAKSNLLHLPSNEFWAFWRENGIVVRVNNFWHISIYQSKSQWVFFWLGRFYWDANSNFKIVRQVRISAALNQLSAFSSPLNPYCPYRLSRNSDVQPIKHKSKSLEMSCWVISDPELWYCYLATSENGLTFCGHSFHCMYNKTVS